MAIAPGLTEIRAAAARLAPRIHRTPILRSTALDSLCGAQLFFKCENFQKAGAFKIRGAANAVFSLDEERARRGVVTHSSGNFAAALALAARWRGIGATVIMPVNAPAAKREATAGYGATIIPCEATLAARETGAARVQAETGAAFLHPYDDYAVIAGQGTAALELWAEQPDLDAIIAPVGGGGLVSGCALATAALAPAARIYAAEPAGADDAARSLAAGRIIPQTDPRTIADGLRTSLGTLTFPIIQRHVADVLTAGEADIVRAMRLIWERMKIIIEPSAAVALAVLLAPPAALRSKRIGVILSGGNVDLDRLPWSAGHPS